MQTKYITITLIIDELLAIFQLIRHLHHLTKKRGMPNNKIRLMQKIPYMILTLEVEFICRTTLYLTQSLSLTANVSVSIECESYLFCFSWF